MGGRKTLWLVGMMGAGKSAVGRELAFRLNRPFVDTDAEIVGDTGRSIAEIFEESGEAAFRTLELETIERLAGREVVVGLGGGAIAQPGAAQRLAESGTVAYLRARLETLLERLGDCAERPLLAGLTPSGRAARLAELLEQRRTAYETAVLSLDTDGVSVAEVADELVKKLGWS